jgi:hypothetical protein
MTKPAMRAGRRLAGRLSKGKTMELKYFSSVLFLM